jgi:hypothetical protein
MVLAARSRPRLKKNMKELCIINVKIHLHKGFRRKKIVRMLKKWKDSLLKRNRKEISSQR